MVTNQSRIALTDWHIPSDQPKIRDVICFSSILFALIVFIPAHAADPALDSQLRSDLQSGERGKINGAISRVEGERLSGLYEDVYAAFTGSEDPHVRRHALFSLSRAGAPQVPTMVVEAIDDPKAENVTIRHLSARELALQRVVKTGDEAVIFRAIRAAIDDPDVYYRKYGAAALAAYPPAHREFADRLEDLANDESAVVRFTFLGKLAASQDPDADTQELVLPLVLDAILEPVDPGDRIAGAFALARFRDWPAANPEDARKLLAFLLLELGAPDEALAGAAGSALVFLKGWPEIEAMVREEAASDLPQVRVYAATVLAEMGKEFEVALLAPVFASGPEALQLRATWLLARQPSLESVALLREAALESDHAAVRKSAVFALRANGWLGEFTEVGQKPNGRPVSTMVLKDAKTRTPEEQVRFDAVAEALGKVTLSSRDQTAGRLAADALVRIGARDAEPEDLLIDYAQWQAQAGDRPARKLNAVAAPRKHLFIDDFEIERLSGGAERVFHRFEKHPANPVFHAQAPWEENWVDNFMCSVHYDPEARDFKLWYRCGANHTLGAFAVSADGVTWQRPDLGRVDYRGSKANNLLGWKPTLYRDAHQPGHNISVLPDAPPERRYLSFFDYSGEKRGFYVSYSPDGIGWSEPKHAQMVYGDVASLIPDPVGGGFLLFPKQALWIDGYRRSFGYTQIQEVDAYGPKTYPFQALTEQHDARVGIEAARSFGVLARNTLDPSNGAYYSNWHSQIYSVTPLIYEGLVLGFYDLWYLTGKAEGPLEMLGRATRNRKTWFDIGYPEPFLARGRPGEWDCGMVYGGSNILVVDDEIRFYYAGFNLGHYTSIPWGSEPYQVMGIGLATMRLDGFASIRAGEKPGVLVTKAVEVTGETLMVNGDAGNEGGGGSIRVEVLDEKGEIIEGVRGEMEGKDALRFPIADLGGLVGQKVRLRFAIENADLYAFWFGGKK